MNRHFRMLSLFSVLTAFAIWSVCDESSLQGIDAASSGGARTAATHSTSRSAGTEERSTVGELSVPVGFYGAPVGRLFSFDFDLKTSYRLVARSQPDTPVIQPVGGEPTLSFHGVLHMQIVQRDREAVTVLLEGSGIRATVPAGADPRGAAAAQSDCAGVEEWFLVTIDTRGTVTGYAFQEGLLPRQRNFARSMVAEFFHTIPATPSPSWVATELDATGEYIADYRLVKTAPEGTEIERVKRAYTSMGTETTLPQHALTGGSKARFDRGIGWLATVRVDESMTVDVTELPSRVHVDVAARFAITDSDWQGISVDESQWPAFVSANGGREDLITSSDAHDRDLWRARVADLSLEQLLDEIRALIEAGETRGEAFFAQWELLSWKLALDPRAVAAAQQLLLHGGLEQKTGRMLLSALGKAGSEEAQGVLLAVYGARGVGDDWRRSAAFSMFQLAAPRTEVLQAVSNRVRDLRDIGDLDAASILLLGAIAPRNTSSLTSGKTALAELVSLERRFRDLRATGLWLDALGNAATPEIAPLAAPYLTAEDPMIRESAVAALDRSAAPGFDSAFVEIAKRDPARDVRLRAIEALGRRDSDQSHSALRELAAGDGDPDIRRAAIQGIAARSRVAPMDLQMLERISRVDEVKEVRDAANSALQRVRSAGQ